MAKFKIGDRVRFIEPYAKLEAGAEGVITGFWSEGVDVNVNGVDHGCFYNRVELIPTITIEPGRHYRTRSGKPTGRVTVGDTGFEAVVDGRVRIFDKAGGAVHGDDDIVEAWVPKVGERVRRFKRHNPGSVVGHEAVVRAIEDILPYDSDGPWLLFDDDTSGYATSFEPLPVAPQPAALKIEAGRYYKTRDGRKVGPLVTTDNNEYWPFKWPEKTMYYKADGYSCPGAANRHRDQDDLVAEWQETTNVGAQVDTLAEEYGPASVAAVASNDNAARPKFKVGDEIKNPNGWRRYYTVSKMAGDKVEIDVDGYKLKYDIEGVDWLVQPTTPTVTTTAIVALVENGQPKPAAVPHVHASEAAAITEAKRLAGVHKGKQFGVFVLATTAEEAAPTYQHEWQRLAKAGKKGDATKLLRNLSGLSLSSSQLAVEDWLKKAA